MIINKEEVEKAAYEESVLTFGIDNYKQIDRGNFYNGFVAGAEFLESKWNEYFIDIITENQGLKLYKDNETERFKKLAIEFAKYIRSNPKEVEDYVFKTFEEDELTPSSIKNYDNIEELLDTFMKERNGNI